MEKIIAKRKEITRFILIVKARGIRAAFVMKKFFNVIILVCVVGGAYYGLEIFRKQKFEVLKPEIVRPVKTVTLNSSGNGGIWYYYGVLQGGKRVDLSFRVAGPINNILVDKGASVKKNELLATLDTRDFKTKLKQAQSNQAQAQAQYDNAKTNFRRYENLYKQKVIPKATYDTQKTQVEVTRSALNAAIAQTAAIKDALKDTELRAPFAGVIADRMAENFQDVTAKQTIFSLQDLSTLEVVFNVPDNDVILGSSVSRNLKSVALNARFDALPDRTFPLTLKEFTVQADSNTNTFPITATMPQQKDFTLLPGMAVTVEIELMDNSNNIGKTSFIIPATALIHEPASNGQSINYVWRVEDNQVHRVAVNVEFPKNNGNIELHSKELRAGDCIVVAGAHLLREGQKVRLMQ